MLEVVVLFAEGFVVFWFVAFLTMMTSMYLDGKGAPVPRLHGAARLLVQNAKLAIIAGITAVIVLTIWEVQTTMGGAVQ